MEFKKSISIDSSQITYWLAEPVTIDYSKTFVKIKYWFPHSNHDNKKIKELIINYRAITSGE
jgi:hypothetical protein